MIPLELITARQLIARQSMRGISKDTLDTFWLSKRKHKQFANNKTGLRSLIRWVQDAAREYLDRMVKVDKSGEQVIRDGTILGQDTNELAAKIARNARQKFRYLSVFIGETMPVHSVEDD